MIKGTTPLSKYIQLVNFRCSEEKGNKSAEKINKLRSKDGVDLQINY